MSDDTQQPIPDIEAALPLEHVEPIETSADCHDGDSISRRALALGSSEESDLEPDASACRLISSEEPAAIDDGEPEAEVIEHGMFDDASDDFAYEAADEEEANADMESEDDSAPYDYDGVVDEEFDPAPKQERENSYGKKKDKKKKALADESGISEVSEFDGDNDPSPGMRLKKHEHTGPAKFAPQRLAKILAAAGIDARRKCEEFVTTGRVTVDGKVITDVAFRADPYSQKIELDGEKLKVHRKVYFVLNKPRGVLCTNFDPSGKPRVIDLFPQFKERIFAIGRLDEESEGLLLVTNDGELANRMAHPRYRVPKFYICHVKGVPTSETLAELKRGMYFDEGKFSVEGVRMKKAVGDSSYLDIVLNEGQNREIRRLLARVNHKVMRLKRVGFGPIRLGDLPVGAFRQLTTPEVALLNDLSQQRAHLDNTAGRSRKKKFGEKPKFGSKPFGARSESPAPAEFSSEGRPPRKSNYGKPAAGSGQPERAPRGGESSYGDRPPRRKFVSQTDDGVIPSSGSDEAAQGNTRQRRPEGRPRPGGYSQGGQGGPRNYTRRDDEQQGGEQAQGQRRYGRRDDNQQQGDSQAGPPRRYSQGSRPPNRQGGYGQGGPPAQRRSSQGDGDSRGGYSSGPPQGSRPPRRYQSDQRGESFQSQSNQSQSQSNDNDGDFNGGRRRFVTDDTPESSFTRRPPAQGSAPPQQRRGYNDENSQPQPGGYSSQRRPAQRRRTGNDESAQPQAGGYSSQRRPARGPPRPYGQAGNRELPSRGQRGARPPKPMTADGKEILEGKVTGYRSLTKDGPARRRFKPILGMQINRKKRQEKRKKTEE